MTKDHPIHRDPQFLYVLMGGYKGAGKDTITEGVIKLLSNDYPTIAVSQQMIAKPVKDVAADYFNWGGGKNDLERALLQVVGDVLREVPQRTVDQLVKNTGMDQADALTEYINYVERTGRRGRFVANDPLLWNLSERVYQQNAPLQVVFLTDSRMHFEFFAFRGTENVLVWIHSDWAKPSEHVTESLDPNTIPGINHVRNLWGSPEHAIQEVYALVRLKLRERGLIRQ